MHRIVSAFWSVFLTTTSSWLGCLAAIVAVVCFLFWDFDPLLLVVGWGIVALFVIWFALGTWTLYRSKKDD